MRTVSKCFSVVRGCNVFLIGQFVLILLYKFVCIDLTYYDTVDNVETVICLC